MEAYLRQGSLPADAEVREFLENLALDALLDEAGPVQPRACCGPPRCSTFRCPNR